jgi:hypothetical protein
MRRSALRLCSTGVVCVTAVALVACGAEGNGPGTSRDHEVFSINTRVGPGFGDTSHPRARARGAVIGGGLIAPRADARCTASHPHYVPVFQGGTQVLGLHECADGAGVSTAVHNTSNDLVWSLVAPTGYNYWTADQDWGHPLAVQLFRATMRVAHSGPTEPSITLEPGTIATIPAHWRTITMGQDPGAQLAWKSATTAVGTAQKYAQEKVENLLTRGSRNRAAVLTCVKSGYELGKSLAKAAGPPQTPSEQLALVFGVGDNVSECARAIQEAAAHERAQGKAAALTVDDLRITTRSPLWRARVNGTFADALELVYAVARRI